MHDNSKSMLNSRRQSGKRKFVVTIIPEDKEHITLNENQIVVSCPFDSDYIGCIRDLDSSFDIG
jgi:hypothetical protein